MRPKTYPVDKVTEVAKTLEGLPARPPKKIGHEEALTQLSKLIHELHDTKNYDAREIVQVLKQNGLKVTLKEVKNLLQKHTETVPKKS